MRVSCLFLAVLLISGCDSVEPGEPSEPLIRFDIQLRPLNNAFAGEVLLSGTCNVFSDSAATLPDLVSLHLDGQEVASSITPIVETTQTVNALGRHVVILRCVLGEESDSLRSDFNIVEPSKVTVHLRNFTQPSEPYVRNDQTITFRLGDQVINSPDSAVFEVLPGEDYEIFAEHPDFHPLWARQVDQKSGEWLGLFNVRDRHVPVHINADRSVDIFKIRISDITSIPIPPNTGSTEPFYSIASLRDAIFERSLSSGVNRIDTDKITFWNRAGETRPSANFQAVVDRILLAPGGYNISALTSGLVTVVEFSESEEKPDPAAAGVIVYLYHEYGYPSHTISYPDDDGAIEEVSMYLNNGASQDAILLQLLRAIGLRGINRDDRAIAHFVDNQGWPSKFARLALKIIYASTPNSRL